MTKQTGTITQVVGVVVDVEFDDKSLPSIFDALKVQQDKKTITLEVAQHLDEHTVRTISLQSTDGLKRGQEVEATGAPISVPVGENTQGRMFNVVGEPIDEKPAPKGKTAPIHREPPALEDQANTAEILETDQAGIAAPTAARNRVCRSRRSVRDSVTSMTRRPAGGASAVRSSAMSATNVCGTR